MYFCFLWLPVFTTLTSHSCQSPSDLLTFHPLSFQTPFCVKPDVRNGAGVGRCCNGDDMQNALLRLDPLDAYLNLSINKLLQKTRVFGMSNTAEQHKQTLASGSNQLQNNRNFSCRKQPRKHSLCFTETGLKLWPVSVLSGRLDKWSSRKSPSEDHKRVLVQTKSLTNRGENYSKDRTQRRDSECRWRKKQKPEDATKEMKCSVNVTYWWVKRSSCKISTVSSAFRLKRRDEGRGARLQNPSRGENQLLQRVCATKASSNVCRGHRHTAASPHYYRHVWLKTWCRADPLHAGPCPSLPGHRVLLWGKLVE